MALYVMKGFHVKVLGEEWNPKNVDSVMMGEITLILVLSRKRIPSVMVPRISGKW